MFFRFLGQGVRRGWLLLLAAWVVLVVMTRLLAPPWEEIAQDREFAFLPASVPSRVAVPHFTDAFPNRYTSNVVLVLHRPGEREKNHLATDLKFNEDSLRPGLLKIAESDWSWPACSWCWCYCCAA